MTQGSAGPVPSPSHWARIQLVQGTSDGGLFDLSSQVPEARVTVGSGPTANWVVQGPTVAPIHFEFFWDGKALWISPPQGDDLTVDGERLSGWRQLVGRARIEFGGAAMLAETSSAIAMPPSAQEQIDALAGDTGQRPPPPQKSVPPPPPRGRASSARPTTKPPPPPGRPPPPPARPGAAPPPRGTPPPSLGSAPVRPPSSRQVPPMSGAAAILSGESTMSFDDVTIGPASSVPAFGDVTPSLDDLGQLPSFGTSQSTQIFDAEAAGLDMSGDLPVVSSPALAPPVMSPPQAPSLAHLSTDVIGRSTSKDNRFAPPPPLDFEAKAKKNPFELPPRRTLILAGVTLVAALLLLGQSFLNQSHQREALEAERQAAAAAEQQRAEAANLAAQAEADARRQSVVSAELALVNAAESDAEDAEEQARDAAEENLDPELTGSEEREILEHAERAAVERLAARAAGRNDYVHALGFYLYLARKYPDEAIYPRIASILRLKVSCTSGVCQ